VKRVLARDGQVMLVDVSEPELRPADVLVQTINSVVSSGTETHIIRSRVSPAALETDQYPTSTPHGPQLRGRGVAWRGPRPNHAAAGYASLGYSPAGRVLSVGIEVSHLAPGDLVACSGNQCAVHAAPVRQDHRTDEAVGTVAGRAVRLVGAGPGYATCQRRGFGSEPSRWAIQASSQSWSVAPSCVSAYCSTGAAQAPISG
jgi:threonine dehydrogenase-like Zn-dependent dehydrogenase